MMKTLLPVLQECLAIMVGGDTKNLPTNGFDEGGGMDYRAMIYLCSLLMAQRL